MKDPATTEVVCLVDRIRKVGTNQMLPNCRRTTNPDASRGLGLSAALKPLRMFSWAKEHQVAAYAIGLSVIFSIYLLGYAGGKGAK